MTSKLLVKPRGELINHLKKIRDFRGNIKHELEQPLVATTKPIGPSNHGCRFFGGFNMEARKGPNPYPQMEQHRSQRQASPAASPATLPGSASGGPPGASGNSSKDGLLWVC